ncbi:MAG: hypothetical protein Kow006_09770 [Gammaproteobacteria bacterium]
MTGVARADILREQSAALMLASAETGRDQVMNRLRNVERLLNTSSGARRVIASDNELAKKIRLDGIKRYESARQAYEAGDYATANRLLEEASKSMFQAIRVMGQPKELNDKSVADFENRARSLDALLAALRRIADSEGGEGKATSTISGINATVSRARRLLNQKQYVEARRVLDGGYEMAKQAVAHLRDGKTLTRTLNFTSPEEEYHYEVDRNDTHQMLVRVLLEEKQPNEQTRAMVAKLVDRANTLRAKADGQAAQGDYKAAIKTLEAATKELVRAIRSAGVYIPG